MTDQNRQPKGVPTGGQFAASAHAEAEVSLTETMAAEGTDVAQWIADGDRDLRAAEGGCCAECGNNLIPDPDGSPGVLVHADEDGNPDYDTDLHHVGVPDEGYGDFLGHDAPTPHASPETQKALLGVVNGDTLGGQPIPALPDGAIVATANNPTGDGPETVATPAGDLREGMVVSLDGDLHTVTSLDGDHKSISVELDHDPDTIASYRLDETLDALPDDAPIPLDVALRGRGMLVVEEDEFGMDVPFHRAHVVRGTNGDGFHATASINEDFVDGVTGVLARHEGYDLSDPEQSALARDHAAAWLKDRRGNVAAYLRAAYDAELNPNTDWGNQAVTFYTTMAADAQTDEIADALTDGTHAPEVWHDLYEPDTDHDGFFTKIVANCD